MDCPRIPLNHTNDPQDPCLLYIVLYVPVFVVDLSTLVSSWAYLTYRDSLVGDTVMCRMPGEFIAD